MHADCELRRAPGMQLEELFKAPQRGGRSGAAPKQAPAAPGRQLAVLDLKRATAIGVRMSRLGCALAIFAALTPLNAWGCLSNSSQVMAEVHEAICAPHRGTTMCTDICGANLRD